MTTGATAMLVEGTAAQERVRLFPAVAGFFLMFRECVILLFFQGDPAIGTGATIAIDLLLVYGAVFYSVDDGARVWSGWLQVGPLRWIFAMLALALASVTWTGAPSRGVALTYWAWMAADVVLVVLLLRRGDVERTVDALMQGAVWGGLGLAVVAWCLPVTPDQRLGDNAFLHPNTLGLDLGLATLMAQYFALRGRGKWAAIALAVTLLRTLSKTAIVAFAIAECWVLLQHKGITRRAKLQITAAGAVVVASMWGALTAYLDVYNNSGGGNQVETLTGRTVVWAAAFSMGLEKPWLGYGIYSFKALIPSFGSFDPVHAHNELLMQFFEYGVAGAAIAVGVYWSFWRQARRAGVSELRTLAMGLLIFAVVRGLADTVSFGLSFPLWLLVALSICLAVRGDEVRV